MIPEKILRQYEAFRITFRKDEMIFLEGEQALHYFELDAGSVKMITRSEEGQEFIQGISYAGESFGEPPLLCNFPYPSTAYAMVDTVIWKLRKEKFFDLIKDHFEIHLQLDQVLCERLQYKNKIITAISFDDPEKRIWWLINYFKNKSGHRDGKFVVPLTRQQMADMVGLRVETVIRTVKKLENNGKVGLVNHKILV
ncbi:MAG: Crp/Fnr family transcriptional regulator [Cyclobacteriaceae bacterium]|nr:Crp/Fnr family transcriptional regulator [Cyclobacteriaceae bacterium]